MKFNIKQAFTYFFNDDKLSKKLMILYPLALFSMIFGILCAVFQFPKLLHGMNIAHEYLLITAVVVLIVSFVVSFLYSGYFISNTNLRIFKPKNKLPELDNWKTYLLNGLKAFLGSLCWQMIIQLILFTVIFILIIFGIIVAILLGRGITEVSFQSHIGGVTVFLFLILFLLAIMCGIIQFAASLSFVTNLEIDSFFNYRKIRKILFKNFKPLFKLLCLSIVFCFLYWIISMLLLITIIGIFFVPVLQVYYSAVLSDLRAQFLRYVFKIV